jgi:hypothetical protein
MADLMFVQCENVADILRTHGIRARAFHSGFKKHEKDLLQDQWSSGVVECIVATIAFGMVSVLVLPHGCTLIRNRASIRHMSAT